MGDYALVIFADAVYPAIVGDVGPNDKAGEASLRIAKQINALSTPYNRPVSDLKVTYLIFSGTADKPFGPPDLDKLQARCEALVKEIGGASVPLHHWENIIPPPPTPTPTPIPSSPDAIPTSSPSQSPTPRIDDTVPLANINISIRISNSQPGWSGSWRTGKPDAYANNFASCVSEALRIALRLTLTARRLLLCGRVSASELRISDPARRLNIPAVS